MLKKNQEMLKKAKAELMIITEAMSNSDKPINIAERPMMDPVALLETVDQMIEQFNEAKAASDGTSVTTITDNRTHDHETESSESEWWSGQGQFNSDKVNSGVTDSLTTNNDIELFVTQQVYTSIDTCWNDAVAEEAEALSIAQLARGQPQAKKVRLEDLKPIVFARFNTRRGKAKSITIKCLLDTGASGSFIASKHSTHLKLHKDSNPTVTWSTANGTLLTKQTCTCIFALPEFHRDRAIQWDMHVVDNLGAYDMIIGRDVLSDLGVKFNFTEHTMEWDGATIAMRSSDVERPQVFLLQEPDAVYEAAECLKDILDAKYEKADLGKVVEENSHLTPDQKHQLHSVLTKLTDLFDGTLGKWNMGVYDIELRPEATPYHTKPYPIPYSRLHTLKLEVERLVQAGVLRKVNRSEWGAPSFIIPKKTDQVESLPTFANWINVFVANHFLFLGFKTCYSSWKVSNLRLVWT